MKALGIVRKIDELGRVVIPKEVRNTQGWEPGTSMEMFMSEEGLVMRQCGNKHEELVDVLKSISDSGSVDKSKLEYLIEKYSV
jgi:AbrB family looped-hinge helix DNA binding protein